jgi:alkylhydroperoxidase/carboxymuconolactone decarboxylase family protein YurZ
MTTTYKEIEEFAKSSLGEMPEVIKLLAKYNENAAVEQFNENMTLYLGRRNIPTKISALIAMAVALANGPKDSVIIHYKLARNFGADVNEILDTMRIAKMALMSSTLTTVSYTFPEILKTKGENLNPVEKGEAANILKKLELEAGSVPERLKILSQYSVELLKEHLREKFELIQSPLKLEKRYVFLIAYAVSASIHDYECEKVYLTQYFKIGGAVPELLDTIAIIRFISGNRAFVNGLEILRKMDQSP